MKRMARITIGIVTLVFFPQIRLRNTYVIIPRRIPLEIEYVRGIIMMQMNAGIDSEKSSSGILKIGSIMSRPTITSAGAVAAAGMDRKRGEKKIATPKHTATESAVRPERPP